MSANAAADYFVRKIEAKSENKLSQLALQILLYYAQGWHLCVRDRPLFEETIEAWTSGPIAPSVWERFGAEGNLALDETAADSDAGALDADAADLLDLVWSAYGAVAPWSLRTMAQGEIPWQAARQGLAHTDRSRPEIPLVSLAAFFSGLRDSLLEEASLAPLEDEDDLGWLSAAMQAHKGG